MRKFPSMAACRAGTGRSAPRLAFLLAIAGSAFLISGRAYAHDPILSCYENKDVTVTCEAGYSDGSPSAGQTIRVVQNNKRLILEDRFGKDSSFTFKKPDVGFTVEFLGDPSHRATFDSEDLKP